MARYDPFEELRKVEEQMDRLFGTFFGEPSRRFSALPAIASRTGSELAPMGEFSAPAIEVLEAPVSTRSRWICPESTRRTFM